MIISTHIVHWHVDVLKDYWNVCGVSVKVPTGDWQIGELLKVRRLAHGCGHCFVAHSAKRNKQVSQVIRFWGEVAKRFQLV